MPGPAQVRRRDGRLVAFDPVRIEAAVAAAAAEAGHRDPTLPARVAEKVVADLGASRRPPTVEEIGDRVERQLTALGAPAVARAYIVYRQRRTEERSAKELVGVRDDLKLSLAAVTVLAERYLLRDAAGRPAESTGEMMDRVATVVAAAEDGYRRGASTRWAERFAATLRSREFLPNSPTLMNAGTTVGLLSGCVVLPLPDSLRAIFTTLGQTAEVHRAGGGTGFSFSALRPAGDPVTGTGGRASGPVSFLRLFDAAAGVVGMGGRRRGACMAVLDVSHPDIYEFLSAKTALDGELAQFNLSVGVSDAFLRAVHRGGRHRLINPRTGRTVATVAAADLFTAICEAAHAGGDPGLLFLDTINRANPVPGLGRITATNPCGEVPLLPYESCNLGSINLARMVDGGRIDWERLAATAALGVRFLDDVIDVSDYPVPELATAARATRKIGLGMMGLAELFAGLGIAYDSQRAVRLAGRLAAHIDTAAHAESVRLAAERGAFPEFAQSRYADGPPRRHAQVTSVAPTGTISLIAGTTAGIEPMFAIAYARNVMGRRLVELNAQFERLARAGGFYTEALITEIARRGGVRGCTAVPEAVRTAYPTAAEIAPQWHLRMQAAVQRHVDAAVSKTINLPAEATVADVQEIYLAAWKAKVKGITVYRYGSRRGQVLTFADPAVLPQADVAYSGGCIHRACEF
ncbi:adenosylcobalamin-dependent ribonucleoside-diphosphate reductase [Mycobacterium koreense]|uniref:adenosylcobalamin-dependent ribonucleoside-diphosphate reductase n=1 Tax=Mycolicibacillus koreensis TaxID=1069220 RepID=UPI00138B28A5|nr:adenosylcobalamin-dependent ribonucleoside-diphosphate reductase [Mycolicibacillus koreensis]MCV7248618.1 adenosylcobalamin-dependent ribonucleoside-diphosphate reductase [Mycolicibacillus koreensis]BBY55580.1 vitamin B12-dependent ribonucleoside-diphosphate reductase [Mycolicibacillus koreensis]